MLGINEPPVTIKKIEKNIVERGFAEGWIRPEPPEVPHREDKLRWSARARRVWPPRSSSRAPATAVTVYEKADRIGGLLRYGIPDSRLEKNVIDRRLEQMRPKAFVRHQCARGATLPVDDLQREFDAILLAGGAEQPRDLQSPGPRTQGHPLRHGISAAAE